MRKTVIGTLFLCVALSACKKEEKIEPVSSYESADIQARAYNFRVIPKSRFLEPQTDLLRRAHFVLTPASKEAPPMAMYENDASVDEVAKWYAAQYEYGEIAPDVANNFSSVKPMAYYLKGDLAVDTPPIKPILEKLAVNTDLSAAKGEYRGAHISPKPGFPRVTIQRPWFDAVNGKVVNTTMVLMVRE